MSLFAAPECYEDLVELFAEHSDDKCLVIVDRLRKCHHPSLAEGNKAKLEVRFLTFIVDFIFSHLCCSYGAYELNFASCFA